MDQGMNRPCGKWPVGKSISLESDADLYIFIENSYGLVRFGVPARWIPLELQRGSPKCFKKLEKNMHKTLIYDVSGEASWRSRGIDRAENGPWQNQFRLRVAVMHAFSLKINRAGSDLGFQNAKCVEKTCIKARF